MTGKANRIVLTDMCAELATDSGKNIALADNQGGDINDALCRGAVDE